jgi:hypothetical protein
MCTTPLVVFCPVCQTSFTNSQLLIEHIDLHYNTDNISQSQAPIKQDCPFTFIKDTSPVTTGLLKILRNHYTYNARFIKSFNLCSSVDFIGTTFNDKTYGCAYRNFQMLLSYLYTIPLLRTALFDGSGTIPNIITIQETLEYSWKCGFDPTGAAQLGYKVKGTKKWIGTAEVAVLLSFFKLRVGIYEFKNTQKSPHQIANWIIDYFRQEREFLPPLYLQYAGHSITIVGVEIGSKGTSYFFVFDPAKSGQYIKTELGQSRFSSVRIPITRFNRDEYQIITIKDPTLLDDLSWEKSKDLQREF